ncbi:hypothetical protein [Intestinibacter sp.]
MKIIRCSKLTDIKKLSYINLFLIALAIIASIFIESNIYISKNIRYTIIVFMTIIIICYEYLYKPIPKIGLTCDKLIDEINYDNFSSYDNKYIKLTCKKFDIDFSKNYMDITFEENKSFMIKGSIIYPSKKCINYLKNIKKEEIVFYGKLNKSNIKDFDIDDIIDDIEPDELNNIINDDRDFYNIEINYLEIV